MEPRLFNEGIMIYEPAEEFEAIIMFKNHGADQLPNSKDFPLWVQQTVGCAARI